VIHVERRFLAALLLATSLSTSPAIAQEDTEPSADVPFEEPAPAPEPPTVGSLLGHVLDSSANVVAGAQVQILDLPDLAAVSDDGGAYVFGSVPFGAHVIVAVLGDSATSTASVATLSVDSPQAVVDLVVAPIPVEQTPDVGSPQEPPSSGDSGSTPPPADAAPTSAPVPAAVATVTIIPSPQVTSGSISGTVSPAKSGDALPTGTLVQVLDVYSLVAQVQNGSYSIPGVPAGTHYLYAWDPTSNTTSDTVSVDVAGGASVVKSLTLRPFPSGLPNVFIGSVKSARGGVLVWRLGGAGITRTNDRGLFILVDATQDKSGSVVATPDQVTLVARSGDQWGFQSFNKTSRTPNISLDLHGAGPTPPQTYDLRTSGASTHVFQPSQVAFVTARWQSNSPDFDTLQLTPQGGGQPQSIFGSQMNGQGFCYGDCSRQPALVEVWVIPPQSKPFTLAPLGGGNPGWDEAQAVGYPPR
jgi:hypothetical protein